MLEKIEGLIPITSSLVDGKISGYFREDTGEDVSKKIEILNMPPFVVQKICFKWRLPFYKITPGVNSIILGETTYVGGDEVKVGMYCVLK